MNSIKLRVRLRVATIKKASCARLRVRRGFGLRSCGCGNSKQVASHALFIFMKNGKENCSKHENMKFCKTVLRFYTMNCPRNSKSLHFIKNQKSRNAGTRRRS